MGKSHKSEGQGVSGGNTSTSSGKGTSGKTGKAKGGKSAVGRNRAQRSLGMRSQRRRIDPPAAPNEEKPPQIERSVGAEIAAVLLVAFGAFLLLALLSYLSQPESNRRSLLSLEQTGSGAVSSDVPVETSSRGTITTSNTPSNLNNSSSSTQASFGAKDGNPITTGRQYLRTNLMGPVGARIAALLFAILGYCSFVTVFWAFLLAKSVWQGWWPGTTGKMLSLFGTVFSSFILAGAFSVIASVLMGITGGGRLGNAVSHLLVSYVNPGGALLLAVVVVFLTFTSSTGVSITQVFGAGRTYLRSLLGLAYKGSAHSGRMVSSVSNQGLSLIKAGLRRDAIGSQNEDDEDEDEEEELDFVLGDEEEDAEDEEVDPVQAMNETPIHQTPAGKPSQAKDKRVSKSSRPVETEIIEVDEEDFEEDFAEEEREIVINRREALEKKGKKEKPSAAEKPKKRRLGDYQIPSPVLLVKGEINDKKGPSDKELLANSKRLEQTLLNFRVGGRVVEVHLGPVVTLYQFEPAAGVKVQRIITLADDLALALKVASIRVYAPVPGRGTVGIEVPREDREIVRLRDLIDAPDFLNPQHHLPLALGKDTFGDPFIADLSRMPHLLIAGATGTGKSVCINSLLLSLLYRHSPDDLRLIMIDPKMLELSVYEEIPHLKAPVVTQPKRARGALWWAVEEMDRRYNLMKELGVRNLASYNAVVAERAKGNIDTKSKKRPGGVIELEEKDVVATSTVLPALDRELHGGAGEANALQNQIEISDSASTYQEPLPRIVIVVDELADLMLTVGREIEELLTRLAQKARAAGIHLILATQRPSVDVITGLIKANFPSRISFKVASRIDARTVLDNSGAERLLGQGDMLFLSPGAEVPKRLHSPFVSDQEVHDVVEWVRGQGDPDYDPRVEAMIEKVESMDSSASGGMGDGGEEEYDPLYDQAYNLVVEKGFASTSMVQRVFRIGYNRAARILETMEREGVVGPADGAKPRQVLVANRNLD